MKLRDIKRRDQVLRTYFHGRDWNENSEYGLKRQLIQNSQELLPDYKYVVEDEWEVVSNRPQHGKGDLVFTDGNGCFAVIEVKWIDLIDSTRKGTTRRNSNTKKRRKVESQAIEYAECYANSAGLDADSKVEAFVFTNEYPYLRKIDALNQI